MPDRPAIPAEIRREVLVEAGHRCAIQTCKNLANLDVHHIIPWKACKEHKADNLIALCPNCHRAAHDGSIDRKSLFKYKEVCKKLANPPFNHAQDRSLVFIKFDPNTVTEIYEANNIKAFADIGVLEFLIIFKEPFEDILYVINALGDGSVNFTVSEKQADSIRIKFKEGCPEIVKLEFKY